MKRIQNTLDLRDKFEAPEGTIDLIYGRIGSGKTYCATEMVLEDLRNGHVVYCNWHLNYSGHDDRRSFWYLLIGLLYPPYKSYYEFPPENLRYFNSDEVDVEWLSSLTDCDVYIDEGQWIFDSYEKTNFSKAKRRLILHTRHLNRRLVIITQRPTAIQVSARGNVNRFFKCEKLIHRPIQIFRQWQFQDMTGETVDETIPVRQGRGIFGWMKPRLFFGKKRIFDAYNTKYLRGGIPRSQETAVIGWNLSIKDKFEYFRDLLRTLKRPKSPRKPEQDVSKRKLSTDYPQETPF